MEGFATLAAAEKAKRAEAERQRQERAEQEKRRREWERRRTLIGRGGDVLIIDDPVKANDANSDVAREAANDWFHNTALSRLDNPGESLIIVTMQRLHVADLSGILIEKGWSSLVIPAVATEGTDYILCEDEIYHRPAGELLRD